MVSVVATPGRDPGGWQGGLVVPVVATPGRGGGGCRGGTSRNASSSGCSSSPPSCSSSAPPLVSLADTWLCSEVWVSRKELSSTGKPYSSTSMKPAAIVGVAQDVELVDDEPLAIDTGRSCSCPSGLPQPSGGGGKGTRSSPSGRGSSWSTIMSRRRMIAALSASLALATSCLNSFGSCLHLCFFAQIALTTQPNDATKQTLRACQLVREPS